MDIEKKIAEALIRVGCLEGVVAVHGDDDIAIQGGHLDDYLLVCDLGRLIERGEMEIKIAPSRMDYVCKLLHMDKVND